MIITAICQLLKVTSISHINLKIYKKCTKFNSNFISMSKLMRIYEWLTLRYTLNKNAIFCEI